MTDYGLVYRPEQPTPKDCLNATIGVKFSNDIYLSKSFLDKHKIKYQDSDLDETPLGPCFRMSGKVKANSLVKKQNIFEQFELPIGEV